jgi:pimeloyl-ACP methyl ester carboxylesterase
MKPITFAGCFGWLHQHGTGALGVVMCASWEYEAAVVGLSWRVLADRLAEAGLPTLRFDYPGCGDSLGSADAPGVFDAALASISAAVEVLRVETGVTRVALVGHRLGGALALMAGETLDVDSVVMIRPITRGKSFVTEQRALGRILQWNESPAVRRDPDPGALMVEGFRLSPESVEKASRIDLAASRGAVPRQVLIAGEKGATHYDALRESLVARGAMVSRFDLAQVAGWAPAPVPVPPPLADCDAIADWLNKSVDLRCPRPVERDGLCGETFRETAVAFGPARSLIGILCQPIGAVSGGNAVVFLNTGANSHIGGGRASVHHARELAARGVASLRMDTRGLGDSPWTEEGALSAIHHVERRVDVSAAIDALRDMNFEGVSIVGVCSGGFLAFQTAIEDPRVDRILLANPRFWLPPTAQELADPMRGLYGSAASYGNRLMKRETWARVLKGEIKPSSMVKIARELAMRGLKRPLTLAERRWAALTGREIKRGELIDQLDRLKARECAVTLVLSEGDPARERLASLLPDRDFAALDGLMRITVVEGADHAFVMQRTRAEFQAMLWDFLGLGRDLSAASAARDRISA